MLLELKSDYLNGKIDKQSYISEMYKIHSILWEYVKLIKNSEVEKIQISEEGVIISTKNGIVFDVPSMDQRVAPIEILNFGSYEQNDWKIMIELLRLVQPHNILDIGANVGYVSLLLSKELDVDNIICFEPIKSTYDYLCKNIKLNLDYSRHSRESG